MRSGSVISPWRSVRSEVCCTHRAISPVHSQLRGRPAITERLAKADPGNTTAQQTAASQSMGGVSQPEQTLPRRSELPGCTGNRRAPCQGQPQQHHPGQFLSWPDRRRARSSGQAQRRARQHRSSLAIRELLAKSDPSNAGWQQNLAISHNQIGGALQVQGNTGAALEAYQAALAINQRLAEFDPTNAGWQQNLAFSHRAIGDVLRAQGNLAGAAEAYRIAVAVIGRVAKLDTTNVVCRDCLAITHISLGEVLQAQGNLSGALEGYRAALALREDLAKSDPGDSGRQQGLSVLHSQIGGVLQAQRNLAAALASYKAAVAIDDRLTKTNPGNTTWQRYLSISHSEVGGVLQAQGKLAAALESYQAALVIAEQLVKSNPGNADGLQSLAAAYSRVAGVHVVRGDQAAALASYRKALTSAEALASITEETEIKRQGKPAGATAAQLGTVAWKALFARNFPRALAASERAHELAPDLLWPETNRAHALLFLQRTREARTLYLAHKGEMSRNRSWEMAIADDSASCAKPVSGTQ